MFRLKIHPHKYILGLFLICTLCVVLACSSKNTHSFEIVEQNYSLDDLQKTSISCNVDSLPVLIDVEDFYIHNGYLLTVSELDTFTFHRFSLDNLSFIDRFGKHGEGPDEFIDPGILICKEPRPLFIIDSWRHRMFSLGERCDTINIGDELMNMPKEIAWPYIGYYRLNGQGREFCIYNIEENIITDSLNISNMCPNLKNVPFFWDTNSHKVVLAFNTIDMVMVFDVSSGKITNCVIGKGSNYDGKVAISSIQCLESCFIILRNITEKPSDGSELILFSYECVPLRKAMMNKFGRRMIYDKGANQLFVAGQDEDYIYSFPFSNI